MALVCCLNDKYVVKKFSEMENFHYLDRWLFAM